ncbi:MAG: GNAT family N-acetyltransferase [Alphaproteobacteria bacterium]
MTGFEIPTLRTQRLVLRAFRADDLPAYAAMLGDPSVARFLGTGKPRDEAESWEAMARALGQWAMRGHGLFAVEHQGVLVGHAGVLSPPAWPCPEIAYAIAPAAQRRGFATEAARAVRDWAGAALGLSGLASFIRPENEAAIAVARGLGAAREADTTIMGIKAQVWRHAPPAAPAPVVAGVTRVAIPELRTARLVLRGFRGADYEPVCAIHADAETMRFLGDGRPRDPALTWAQLCMWTGAHALGRGGWFAVTRAADGAVVGRCGVNAQPGWPEPELAYTIARACWGQGYAQEAAEAVRDWAWREGGHASLASLVKVGNDASANVARKLGARLSGTFEFEGKPTQRWEYPRPA